MADIVIGIAKQATALASRNLRISATGKKENGFRSKSESVSISGSRFDQPSGPPQRLSLEATKMHALWKPPTAETLRIKAAEIEGKGAATGGIGARSDGT